MTGTDKPQLAFRGLVTNPNELAITGDGAFRLFTNGILSRTALAQARRGIKWNATNTSIINKLFNYDGYLLFHCGVGAAGKLRILNAGTISATTGNVVPISGRLRACISGKNFYMAGTQVMRLAGVDPGYIDPVVAGGLFAPGFDSTKTALPTGSMLASGKACVYRYLFGLTDEKENLHVGEPSGRLMVINTGDVAASPTIRATVPSTATTSHFIQFYRSAQVAIDATDGLYHCDDDLQLCFEQQLTALNISNGYVDLSDVTPDLLRGALIYTAPLARDSTAVSLGVSGIESANRAPPSCLEICEHNNRTWFANTTQPGEFLLRILSVGGTSGIQHGDTLYFIGITAAFSAFNLTAVGDYEASLTRSGGNLVTAATVGNHGYSTGNWVMLARGSANFGIGPFQITVTGVTTFTYAETGSNVTLAAQAVNKAASSAGLAAGEYVLRQATTLGTVSHRIEATSINLVAAFNKTGANTTLWAQYLSEGENPGEILFRGRTAATTSFRVYTGVGSKRACFSPQLQPGTHTVTLTRVAGLVTATAAATSFITGEQVEIAPGGPGSGGSDFGTGPFTVAEGALAFFSYLEAGLDGVLAAQAASITPIDTGLSTIEAKVNRVYYSKFGEHEATTRNGWVDVGSSLGTIRAMKSQRGQIWVWKTDGIFRIIGGADPSVVPQDIRVEAIDTSLSLLATESVVLFANRCWGLTSRGVVAVSESGIEVMSGAIADDLVRAKATVDYYAADLATAGYGVIDFDVDCFATAYESEHSYILHIPSVFGLDGNQLFNGATKVGDCALAYVYNAESRSWSLWDWGNTGYSTYSTKRCALVSAVDDRLYLGDGYNGDAGTGYLFKERKGLFEGTGGDYRDTTAHHQTYSLSTSGGDAIHVTGSVSSGSPQFAVGDSFLVTPGSADFPAGPWVVTAVTSTTISYLQSGGGVATLAGQVLFKEAGIALTWAWILQTMGAPASEKRWDELKFIFGQRESYFPTNRSNSQKAFNLALANETAAIAAFAVAAQETQLTRVWVDAEVARGHRLLVTLTHSTIDEAFDLSGIDFKAEVLGGAPTR